MSSGLEDAKRMIKTADHMIYVTYPILKENRLLIRILEQIDNAVLSIISTILQHEYAYKRIKIYNDDAINLETFEGKCCPRYGIPAEYMKGIKELLDLMNRHKKSPMEFIRQNKFIIMSDDLRTDNITMEKLKFFLTLAKDILRKTEMTIASDKSYF